MENDACFEYYYYYYYRDVKYLIKRKNRVNRKLIVVTEKLFFKFNDNSRNFLFLLLRIFFSLIKSLEIWKSQFFLIAHEKKKKKQSSPRLRFNDHIPNSPDSLSPPTTHEDTSKTPSPILISAALERAPLPPPFEASDFLVIDATPPFVFLPGARFPFLSRAKGGHAPPSALPLLLYVSSGAALFVTPPLTQRARGTVPRKPGHGPRGCTVNA